jgi:hypothetical protein
LFSCEIQVTKVLLHFRTQLKRDSGRCWYEGSKNEYHKTVATKHWNIISDFLFGDVMNHEHDAQTDNRFKDGHNKKKRRELQQLEAFPLFNST